MISRERPTIEVSRVTVTYGDTRALNDVSVTVGAGEKVALLGPNGAGKTTLIEVIAGFRKPANGTVSVHGSPVSPSSRIPPGVGLVLQHWRDHPKWTVAGFLSYVAAAHRASGRDTLDVGMMLREFDLADTSAQKLQTLSGGQRRKIDVVAALLGRPGLLILDEPTTGFDPDARIEFQRRIEAITEDTTLLIATHDLVEADRLADRLLVMDKGSLVMDGDRAMLEARVGGSTTITYRRNGIHYSESVGDPDEFLDDLYSSYPGQIRELHVTRGSLEDLYLALRNSDTQDRGSYDA